MLPVEEDEYASQSGVWHATRKISIVSKRQMTANALWTISQICCEQVTILLFPASTVAWRVNEDEFTGVSELVEVERLCESLI